MFLGGKEKFYGKSSVTFGVLGAIPSYLVIIFHILCVFEKNIFFDVKIFFRRKISDSNQNFPLIMESGDSIISEIF